MEIKGKIKQTKQRRKGFLKALPEEQRRLLKMHERAKNGAKMALYGILIWFLLLLAIYLVVSILFPYARHWMWNGIIAGALFILGTVLLLVIRHSNQKKAKAFASSITEYVNEYDTINSHIAELKKAEKSRVKAERAAEKAEKKARAAAERAQETEAYAKAVQEQAEADVAAANEAIRQAKQFANDLVPDAQEAPSEPPALAEPAEPVLPPVVVPEPVVEPEPVSEPEVATASEPVPEPEATAEPEAEPEVTADPEPVDEPEATAESNPVFEPEQQTDWQPASVWEPITEVPEDPVSDSIPLPEAEEADSDTPTEVPEF